MKKEGLLGCNIKFMIEGEEEVGSDHLEEFVKNNKSKLECDDFDFRYRNDFKRTTLYLNRS